MGEKGCGETDRREGKRGRELEREDEAERESDEGRTTVRRGGCAGAGCRHTRQTAADACDAQYARTCTSEIAPVADAGRVGSVFDTVESRYGGA